MVVCRVSAGGCNASGSEEYYCLGTGGQESVGQGRLETRGFIY